MDPNAVDRAFADIVRANRMGGPMSTATEPRTLSEMTIAEREATIRRFSAQLKEILNGNPEGILAAELLDQGAKAMSAPRDDVARVVSRLLSAGELLLTDEGAIRAPEPPA